ncbi:MAG: hypothetical protein JST80_00630 [Bdellovibrionales bacterium]|nr:hypothetical protein [Bdellovibrionales bacterium]
MRNSPSTSEAREISSIVTDSKKVGEICDPLAEPYGGGGGTSAKPYLICANEQFLRIPVSPSAYFRLKTDLDFSGDAFAPLFSVASPFNGTFDGNGHSISNIAYNNAQDRAPAGVFRAVGISGRIINLEIAAIEIEGYQIVGGLVGILEGSVESVELQGTITSSAVAGGMIGRMGSKTGTPRVTSSSVLAGTLVQSRAVGAAFPSDYVASEYSAQSPARPAPVGLGGFVGEIRSGAVINDSLSEANVKWLSATLPNGYLSSAVGGFVGMSRGANVYISGCSARGAVGGFYQVGGFIGHSNNTLSISNSHAYGNVGGDHLVGGFGGYINDAEITDCSARGSLSVKVNSGGFIGGIRNLARTGVIERSFYNGAISCGPVCSNVGGFIGSFFNNYDKDTEGQKISDSFSSGTMSASGIANKLAGFIGSSTASAKNGSIQYAHVSSFMSSITASSGTTYGFAGQLSVGSAMDSIYYWANNRVPTDAYAKAISSSELSNSGTYSSYDFANAAIWHTTTTNSLVGSSAPILSWACTLNGVTCN